MLGRNIKVIVALLYPVALLAYIPLSAVAVLPVAVAFSLLFPGYVTLETKRQTAWRFAYFWAGWKDTMVMAVRYLVRYYYSVTQGFREQARVLRRKAWPTTYDFHPLNVLCSVLMLVVGGAVASALLLVLLALKVPFLMLRAELNHIAARDLWLRSLRLGAAWVIGLLLVPLGPPLLLLAALPYSFYSSAQAGRMVILEGGALLPALTHLAVTLADANDYTTRYMLRQDVPFMALPAELRAHGGWMLAGLLPALFGLVVVTPVGLLIAALSIFPITTAAWQKIGDAMSSGSVQARPWLFVALCLLGLIVPALAPLACIWVWLVAAADAPASALLVTHARRSLVWGFQYPLGALYRLEYTLNKFALALEPSEQVHWASLLPRSFGLYAQPYMDAAEWDAGGGGGGPVTIIGRPARYVPPGLRRPMFDNDGSVVDMSGAAYDVPGVGLTRVGADGTLAPPVKGHPMPGLSSLPAVRTAEADLARAKHKLSGAPTYGVDILPAVYRTALAGWIVGGVQAGGLSRAGRSKALSPGSPSSPRIAVTVDAGATAGAAKEVETPISPASTSEEEADAHAHFDSAAVPIGDSDEGGCCAWLSCAAPPDGYEEEDETEAGATGEAALTLRSVAVPKSPIGLPVPAERRRAEAAASSPQEGTAPAVGASAQLASATVGAVESDEEEEEAVEVQEEEVSTWESNRGLQTPVDEGDSVLDDDEEDDEEEDDEEEDEDEVFILQPISKAELPDEWIAVRDADAFAHPLGPLSPPSPLQVKGPSGVYYANYARNQSSWVVPPGVELRAAKA